MCCAVQGELAESLLDLSPAAWPSNALSPNPLPGYLVAHQYSEIIQAEFFFPSIPFSSFLKSSSPPLQLWLCISFLPLSAQTPQMLSLPLLKHPRIYLSLQLLLQKSLSLFRFSLASYKFLLSISSHFNTGHCPPLSQRFCCHREGCSQIVQLSHVLSYHHPLYLLGSDQNCVQQSIPEL